MSVKKSKLVMDDAKKRSSGAAAEVRRRTKKTWHRGNGRAGGSDGAYRRLWIEKRNPGLGFLRSSAMRCFHLLASS
jgi:hypothetical protein